MISLRPYQLELIEVVWQEMFHSPTVLAQLPTGGGKTLCFSHLIKKGMEAKSDMRTMVIMGRIDLVTQTERAIARVVERKHIGVYCGTINRKELNRQVTVASIQSLRALHSVPFVNMLIIDEVHNLDEENKGGYLNFVEKLKVVNPKLKVIGFTATPFRNRGYIFGEDKLFKKLSYKKTIQDMIAMGFLCRPILKQSDNAFDTSTLRTRAGEYMQEDVDVLVSNEHTMELQIKEALKNQVGRISIAWATANIDHCNRVLNALEKEGEYATSVHSKQNRDTRNANLSAFMGGSCRHMVFVSVLSEGFDHPPIDCVVLMRPTRSPVLYVQTVGRGLRIYENKKDCLVLDYGQVVRELGPLDDPKVKGKKGEGEAVLKCCPQCSVWCFGGCMTCPECSFAFPPPLAPEEKLTKRHDATAQILSEAQKPTTEVLGPITITMHEAKSGNMCVRIIYEDRNILNRWGGFNGVSEYFVTTSAWAMERLEARLNNIGASLPSIPFENDIVVQGTFQVIKKEDGKYDRVLSVKKISDESPVTAKQKQDDDDPTSFSFGANANSPSEIGF